MFKLTAATTPEAYLDALDEPRRSEDLDAEALAELVREGAKLDGQKLGG